jgi:hypothetical protein
MGAQAKQLNLFQAPAVEPVKVDYSEGSRRHLQQILYLMRTAEIMPWRASKAASVEKLFRELAPTLPDGEVLLAELERELARLRASQ